MRLYSGEDEDRSGNSAVATGNHIAERPINIHAIGSGSTTVVPHRDWYDDEVVPLYGESNDGSEQYDKSKLLMAERWH